MYWLFICFMCTEGRTYIGNLEKSFVALRMYEESYNLATFNSQKRMNTQRETKISQELSVLWFLISLV
jgi:hypothetical protein